MPDKKDSYQPTYQGGVGLQPLPSQESIDLFNRLLQEFMRGSSQTDTSLPPEVERDIAAVAATFDSLEKALALGKSPIAVTSVVPSRGPAAGGTRVTIAGSHLLPGTKVRFGNADARDVLIVSLSEIQATTPGGPAGSVSVNVTTLGGSATLLSGFTYQA